MLRPNAAAAAWPGARPVCLAAAAAARGEVLEFVLDPARSRITAAAGFGRPGLP
jgi:hypothetical protein